MANLFVSPRSVHLDPNSRIAPGYHIGATNGRGQEPDFIVEASLGADSFVDLMFPVPAASCSLVLSMLCNTNTGTMYVTPAWASVAVGENYDTITLNSEGQQSLAWTTGDEDKWKELSVALDADTPVAGEKIQMRLTFNYASWGLTQRLAVFADIEY